MIRRRTPRWLHRSDPAPASGRPNRTTPTREMSRRLDQRTPLDHRPPIV